MPAFLHHPCVAALLLLCMAPTAPQAQAIYRCGNTYSQTPCPGGAIVAADDRRSAEQKAQTDAAAAQAARQADGMQRERLALERAANAQPPAATTQTARSKAKQPVAPRAAGTGKPAAPAYFTASSGPDDAKKKLRAEPAN